MKYDRKTEASQGRGISEDLAQRLEGYISPLLETLTNMLDKRLVKTFLGFIAVIISFRGYGHGLLLSELGGYLMPPGQATAGKADQSLPLYRLRSALSRLWLLYPQISLYLCKIWDDSCLLNFYLSPAIIVTVGSQDKTGPIKTGGCRQSCPDPIITKPDNIRLPVAIHIC